MQPLNTLILAIATCGALGAGCGSEPTPVKAPENTTTAASTAKPAAATAAPKRKDTDTPTSGSVHIDDKILKACGDLPTARFAFDSVDVAGDAAAALDALGRCFVSGPLKGKSMRLVGHADPRGETGYNFALGQKRAGSVGEYLTKKGLEQGRINTTSKGEMEATGTDDEGWARDRKVEIFLVE
jgi:peptidoglycan-associated lipoprotein